MEKQERLKLELIDEKLTYISQKISADSQCGEFDQ